MTARSYPIHMLETGRSEFEGETEGILRPGVCLGFGVVLFAFYLLLPYILLRAERDLERSLSSLALGAIPYILVPWGVFVGISAHCYSAREAETFSIRRTLVSGLIVGPILFVFLFVGLFGPVWYVGNLVVLGSLYGFWIWIYGFSRTDALNLAIAAMPIGLILSFLIMTAITGLVFSGSPR